MQNTIFAIIALALFGIAQAQVQFSGACPSNVEVQCDFKLESYLGLWYEYAKYPVYFETNGKCITAEYTLKATGQVGVVNSMINTKTDNITDIVGYAVSVENAKLKVTFPITTSFNATTNYWVLSTDYTSYSVVYSCQSSQDDTRSVYVWILTRERKPSADLIAKAENVLTQNGVSLSELTITDQSDCEVASITDGSC